MKEIQMGKISGNVHFHHVYGMKQRWCNKKNSFSYMATPRPDHGFMYVLCDRAVMTMKNGEKLTFKNGDIIYIPKGIRYLAEFYGDGEEFNSLLINFQMEEKQIGEFVFCRTIKKLVGSASARYTDDFHKIIYNYAGMVNNGFAIMSAFYSLLDNLTRHLEKKKLMNNEYNIIAPAIIYMDSHVNENTNIPELAKMCLVSETCFRRYFRKYTGMSPAEYKMKAKIKKAIQMLKTDAITTAEIVADLNFYDLSYFYKIFKRETGMTPAEYLNNDLYVK